VESLIQTASADSRSFRDTVPLPGRSPGDADRITRCYAALALKAIDMESYRKVIEELHIDRREVKLYDFVTGLFVETTVGEVARIAMGDIDSPGRAA
jgi:hypothetical protein